MTHADLAKISRHGPSATTLFAGVLACALVLVFALRPLGFVHHDTSEIVMWANTGLSAGFWKHPPFLPWLVYLWSLIAPTDSLGLALLTAINMTVCAFAVWQLARLAGRDDLERANHGLVALLLLAAVPYATFMAIKLNHNAILISLWPLTVLAFLRALERPTVIRGIAFGIVAAAAVLAKYYSFLLLAGCLAASIANRERAIRYYRGPAPYVTIVVFVAAMLPHVMWLFSQPASPLGYAFSGGVAAAAAPAVGDYLRRGPLAALLFLVGSPLVVTPMVLVALFLAKFGRGGKPGAPHPFEWEIVVLTAVPWLLTAVVAAIWNLRAPIPWAMPVFVSLPAIVAARVGAVRHQVLRRWTMSIAIAMPLIAIAGQIGVRQAIIHGTDGVSDPRSEIASIVTGAWREATGKPLALIGGDPRLVSGTAVFSPDHPQGWPMFSQRQAPWIDSARARSEGFAALCRAADPICIATTEKVALGQQLVRCPLRRRLAYLGATGPPFEAVLFLVLPSEGAAVPAPVCPARD